MNRADCSGSNDPSLIFVLTVVNPVSMTSPTSLVQCWQSFLTIEVIFGLYLQACARGVRQDVVGIQVSKHSYKVTSSRINRLKDQEHLKCSMQDRQNVQMCCYFPIFILFFFNVRGTLRTNLSNLLHSFQHSGAKSWQIPSSRYQTGVRMKLLVGEKKRQRDKCIAVTLKSPLSLCCIASVHSPMSTHTQRNYDSAVQSQPKPMEHQCIILVL